MNHPPKCLTCKFWTPNRGNSRGQCKRFPPMPAGVVPQASMLGGPPQIATIFTVPETQSDDWCGEHAVEIAGVH